jgi:hypothetical protein
VIEEVTGSKSLILVKKRKKIVKKVNILDHDQEIKNIEKGKDMIISRSRKRDRSQRKDKRKYDSPKKKNNNTFSRFDSPPKDFKKDSDIL